MTSKCTQKLTTWQERVWEAVRAVPPGFVTTYKEVAGFAGSSGSARAVGHLLAKNSKLVIIPCHRVVKSSGEVGGYARGKEEKKRLLRKEGVKFVSDNKVDLEECFFNLIA